MVGDLALTLNVTKCYHLGITSKRTPLDLDYSLNGKFISRVSSTTYLGIHITANSTLCLLRPILSGCSAEVKSSAYLTLVRPKRECASSVWNPYKKCNIDKTEMVQHRAARFVFNDHSRSSSVSVMINTLGWDSLEHRRLLNQVCMFYKIYNGLVGISLPAEIPPITRASRLPNCTPFVQLCMLNDTFKFFFFQDN